MGVKRLGNLCGFAVKCLANEWGRTVALAAPLVLVLAIVAAMSFVRDGLAADAHLSTAFLPDITVQMLSSGRSTHVQAGVAERIRGMANVREVAPRIWGILPLRSNGQDVAYTLLGIDPARMPIAPEIRFALKAGRFLRSEDRGCLVLGESVAHALHAHVGDTLAIRTPAGEQYHFHVIGIFTTAVQIYAADLLLTHLEDARRFFDYQPGEAADLCVYLTHPARADYAAAAITAALPACRVLTRDKLARVLEQAYGSRSGTFQLVWLILLVNVALSAMSQAGSAALQQKKEVGILKALGWSVMDIIQVRVIATAITTLFACLTGICLGLLYVYLGAAGVREYLLGWAALYPEFRLPICVRPETLLTLLAIGTVPIIAAVIVPCWLAGIEEPDRSIRGRG